MSARSLLVRIINLFRRSSGERELQDEIESNLQLDIDQRIQAGATPEQARRESRLRFGSVESAKESWRDQRSLPLLETFGQDLRYALRTLKASRGFAFIAIATLALGIGANTAIFTIVNAVLIEPLPFKNPDSIVVVWEFNSQVSDRNNVVSPANFIRWTERATVFEEIAGFYEWRGNLTGMGDPEQLVFQNVTSNYFKTIGVDAMIGRTFAKEEGREGNDNVTVLSHALWKRRFGADPSIVGRSIEVNGQPLTVIGVMPPDVSLFIKNGSLVGRPAELWTPFAFTENDRRPRGRYMTAIARLKPGISKSEAQSQMTTIAMGLAKELPQFDANWDVRIRPLHEELASEVRPALLILTGAVAFVLLIACANVATLLLARGTARRREIAIRSALGAGRARVLRQLLTESFLLSAVGGVSGVALGRWLLRILIAISPVDVTRFGHVDLSYTVLGFTTVISFFTALTCGFIPAFETVRVDVQESLKDGARQTAGTRSHTLRRVFVVGQIAAAVVLLSGAGLLLRSFSNTLNSDPGFSAENVLTFKLALPGAKYDSPEKTLQFFGRAIADIRALPGVTSAGEISFLPLAGPGAATGYTIPGQPPPAPGKGPVVDMRIVDNGYFETMKVPLLKGRLFSAREQSEATPVAVINETMAKQLPADPIGQRIVFQYGNGQNGPQPVEVIGVVGDIRHVNLTTAPRAMAYWAHPQLAMTSMTVTVRTQREPTSVVPTIANTIRAIDKDLPLSDVQTMEQWLDKSVAQIRFSSTLVTAFGALALVLAAIGIYGVMSYAVQQRSSEIAVRLALGAERRVILNMVVRNAVVLVIVGIAIGIPGALFLNQALSGLLYNTSAADPGVFAIVVVLLALVAVTASFVPAWRASRIGAVSALRRPS